ncbi:MAG: hypothetical protein ABIW76_02310 [Fibrobacteria bacterium]
MGTGLRSQRLRAIVVNGSDVNAGREFNLAGNGDGNVAGYRFLDSKPCLLK